MRPSQIRVLIISLFLLFFLGWLISSAADYTIEYNWWKEVGQVDTWLGMLWYSVAPAAVGTIVAFVALWMAHANGLHFAGVRKRDYPLYSRLIPVALALVSFLFATSMIDYWTVMRFFGSRGVRGTRRSMEGPGIFARLALLFVRPAILFATARLCVCARHSLRPALLGHGARMAVGGAFPVRGTP